VDHDGSAVRAVKFGFTGSQHMPLSFVQFLSVAKLIEDCFEPDSEFHYGRCIGWDDKAAAIARSVGYRLIGHPPTDRRQIGRVIPDIELPPLPYLERDRRLVDATRKLLAAPHTPYEVLRSGTWATVRFAVRRGKPGQLVKPDGTVIPIERAVSVTRDPKLVRDALSIPEEGQG
jgi:hypothetical protein